MKKYLILPTAALTSLMMTTSAFALTTVKPAVDETGNVRITVETDKAGEQVYTVMVMKAGKTAAEGTGSDSINDVYRFETIKGTGKAELSFKVKDTDAAGLYEVIVGGGELSGKKASFAIADSDKLTEALARVNGATASTIASVLDEYNNTVWVVDLSDSVYTADKTNIHTSFVTIANKSLKSAADVEKCFRNACALSEIAKASSSEVLELLDYHAEELGLTYNDTIKANDKDIMNAFVYLAKDSATNPINSTAQLETVLARAEALGKVNSATRKTLQGIIEDATYNSILGVDITGSYAKLDKYEIIKLLIKDKGDYTSIKEFKDAFDAAVKTVKAADSKPASTSGGGGGGGGGGGTSFGITPSLNVTDPGTSVGTRTDDSGSEYFNDTQNSGWAVKYIDYAAKKGIMSGDGNGSFRPNDKITREEFLKTVLTAFDVESEEIRDKVILEYGDVSKDDWFYEYVERGTYYGIINGMSADSFGTGKPLTRQDAAVILMRVKEAAKLALKDIEKEAEFTDGETIAEYAAEAVKQFQKAGVINGYDNGEFRPNGQITRAEAAKMVYAVLSGANQL